MRNKNILSVISNVSHLIAELAQAGITVEIGNDFLEFRRLRNAQADRHHMFPMFDIERSYVEASNAFWVCGFNNDGELVHTQAIRLLSVEEESLADHLRHHRHKYITPGSTPDADRTFFTDLPTLRAMRGQIAYHGEFWIKSGVVGRRNQGLTSVLSRIAFELTMALWSPDFIFGLVPTSLANRGVTVRYGYPHSELGEWIGPSGEVTAEETLVWMNRQDLQFCIDSKPRSISSEVAAKTVRDVKLVQNN